LAGQQDDGNSMPSSEHQVDDATELPLHGLPVVKPAPGPSLLGGIRVVDLTTSIAGPYASMLLGDFGAEIVKVERPEGDDARGWGPPFLDGESLWFAAVNRNKKSVVLDLGDENDRPPAPAGRHRRRVHHQPAALGAEEARSRP
jgi:hypothetical protein